MQEVSEDRGGGAAEAAAAPAMSGFSAAPAPPPPSQGPSAGSARFSPYGQPDPTAAVQQQVAQQQVMTQPGAMTVMSPPPPPAPMVAPGGWMELMDPSTGRPYYCNPLTGQTSWERPGMVPQQQAVQQVQVPVQQQQYAAAAAQQTQTMTMDPASIAAWQFQHQQVAQQQQQWLQQQGQTVLAGAVQPQDPGRQRCKFYGPGTTNDCRRGDSCPFIHDDTPAVEQFCRFFGPGTANDCRRGDQCPYIHDMTGQQRASAMQAGAMAVASGLPPQKPPPSTAGKRCDYWGPGTNNDCRRGAACPYVHDESERNQRCRFFGPGTPNDCRRGHNCKFIHDPTGTLPL